MNYGPKQQPNQMVPMMIQEGKMAMSSLTGQTTADLKSDVLGHVKGLFHEDTF
jgi:dTDP-D-glucose 4,6-dehydratase